MGILDQAIEANPWERSTASHRIDRVIDRLNPHLDLEEVHALHAMLTGDVTEWGHVRMAKIIRAACDEVGVNHENVTNKDVEGWRKKPR